MNLYKIGAAAVCGLLAFTASAQETYSGYFTESNLYRHQMNPAFANETNYVGTPVIGNMNFGVQGNLHLKSILYNVDGQTTTFLNPAISASEVMSNIRKKNKIGAYFNIPILGGGFSAWGGYNTVTISARGDVHACVPGELVRFLKEGVTNDVYNIGRVNVTANSYAELALGHSRQINSQVRVGGKLKFLIGVGNVDANASTARLTLNEDSWDIVTNAEIHSSVKGLRYETEYKKHLHGDYVNDVKVDNSGPNGFGMGIDLGVEYKCHPDWTFSAAVLDFGWITWNNDVVASTGGEQQFSSSVYSFNANGSANNSFKNSWLDIRDDLTRLYQLEDMGDQGKRSTLLNSTINLGAEYVFPLYRKLTFGFVNSTHIAGKYTCTNFRLSANVAPVKVFSCGVNVAEGTYGFDFGWIANVHAGPFNMSLGMDHTLGKLAKQGVPLSSNGSFNLGISWMF